MVGDLSCYSMLQNNKKHQYELPVGYSKTIQYMATGNVTDKWTIKDCFCSALADHFIVVPH